MRYVHTQSGAALVILLTIFILGSLTFLLAEVNKRTHYLIEDQKQTIQALSQAKESLLGFAAIYAQNHEVKLQGYLPCPDKDGDGSVISSCDQIGETVLGRLPWRTLGLPPLRDGSGECLWYAVSGNFKNAPKQVLTSDSNGLIEFNAQAETVSNQVIAMILAPGRSLKGQEDRYKIITGDPTECGSKTANQVIDPINHVRNYLDKYNFNGIIIDNVTANNSIFYSTNNNGYFATSPNINVTPRFINAPPVYETYLNPQDGTERIDPANPTFNDTLVTITPEDFKPVYRMMDYQVATQVKACLDRYAQQNLYHFIDSLQTLNISSDSNNSFTFMEKILEITNNDHLLKDIKDNIANKENPFLEKIPYPKYPWPSAVNPYDYTDDENNYFGRIPTKPVENTQNINLSNTRKIIIDLFDQDSNSKSVKIKLENLWSEFEQHYSTVLLNQWPVDPQESFAIFDLHDLEYEELENISEIEINGIKQEVLDMLKEKVLDTLKEEKILEAFAQTYNIGKEQVGTTINGISDKTQLIKDIKSILTEKKIVTIDGKETEILVPRALVYEVLQKYQCFNSSSTISQWGWWPEWRDKVFFAIHSDYSLNNSIENLLAFEIKQFETEQEEEDVIYYPAEMLVLVAGRSLDGQQRSQDTHKTDITNYLEDKNSDEDTIHFIRAPVRYEPLPVIDPPLKEFNDILL